MTGNRGAYQGVDRGRRRSLVDGRDKGKTSLKPSPRSWWFELQSSLWFLPAVLTAAAALALLTVEIDLRLLLDRRQGTGWFFGGGAEGARGVLAAIAGTMINVTALVFSITVVALQLAASQLTPRVLRSFMSDRGNQVVLGFFIGTFTYALLVLRAVRAPLDEQGGFVPAVSVSVAIVLALASVAFLIYFVHHAANSIRVSVVVDRVTKTTLDFAEELYPPTEVGQTTGQPVPDGVASPVRIDRAGYLQTVDTDNLLALAAESALDIRIEPCVGDFVLPGTVVATVFPPADPEMEEAIRGLLTLGAERTTQEDIEFGVVQLADIAVKALSPGINDPTTAMGCIDRLAEVLLPLARRIAPNADRLASRGAGRVVLAGPSFERLVGVAFDRARHYGAGDAHFTEHLITTLGRMSTLVPPIHRPVLIRKARSALTEARAEMTVEEDIELVERAARWAVAESPPAEPNDERRAAV